MSSLIERVRTLSDASQSRIDFEDAKAIYASFIEEVQKETSIDELTRRQILSLAIASQDLLNKRWESAVDAEAALKSIQGDIDRLPDPEATLLKVWFYHVLFNGSAISDELLSLGGRLAARLDSKEAANAQRIAMAIARYEWLATYGPDPRLTLNNLRGLSYQLAFLPLSGEFRRAVQDRCRQCISVASLRMERPTTETALECIDRCLTTIRSGLADRNKDNNAHLDQTLTWCIRVGLASADVVLRSNEDASGLLEEASAQVAEVRAALEEIGYRSSTVVFRDFEREAGRLRATIDEGIEFNAIFQALRDFQHRVNLAAQGEAGKDRLERYHHQQARALISPLFDALKAKRTNAVLFAARLAEIERGILQLEEAPQAPTASRLKAINASLARNSSIFAWADELKGVSDGLQLIEAMRERMKGLWARMEAAEPQHLAAIQSAGAELQIEIEQAISLPSLLSEIRQLQRLSHELSPPSQRAVKETFDNLFAAFRARAKVTGLLLERVAETNALVANLNRRLSSISSFDDLFDRARELKRWVSLQDFPQSARSDVEQLVRECTAGIYKLQARHKRWQAERLERSTEIFSELSSDVDEVTVSAARQPGSTANWEELVGLHERLRSARSILDPQKYEVLSAKLDSAFGVVKRARTIFALESERQYAQMNEPLSDMMHALERSPTKDTALEAIELLKACRKQLRTERTLLRKHREALSALVGAISRAVDEVFDEGLVTSERERQLIRSGLDRLDEAVESASDWRAVFNLIFDHKEQSAALRGAAIPIREKRQHRIRLEAIWDTIEQKLERYRHTRAQREEPQAAVKRLEQKGWLVVVEAVPHIS